MTEALGSRYETANASATLTGLVLAGLANNPGRVAIRCEGADLTARQVLEDVHRTARALLETGLGRGDGVTVLAGNRPETVVVRLAANLIGCRIAMLYADRPVADQLATALDARTTAFVFDPQRFGPAAARIAAGMPEALLLALGPTGLGEDLLRLAAPHSPRPVAPRFRPEDVMAIRFTGGSTGRPKGIQRYFARPTRPPLEDAGTFLLCTALCHGGGTTADLALAAGGTVVLQEGFDAAAVLAAVERDRVTRVYLPPHLLHQVLDHPDLDRTDTGSLRRVSYTGCLPSPERLAEATRRLGPVLHQTYSLTEAGPVTRLHPQEHLDPRLLTTAGRPFPDSGVRILDDRGRDLGPGRTGEIWVRTPTMMSGYWRNPELTAQVLHDGWLRTGDLGRLDAAGYLIVEGRRGAMAIVNARNVFPRDVEGPLLTHPAVREAVMFSTVDRDRQESVHAAVTTVPGVAVTAEQLRRWVRELNGPHSEPRSVLLLPRIPITEAGKPDLAALRTLTSTR
ncbi:fatty-acyl-CoA synthase [Kitasatospora sp. MAA4]|uniref:AMP-binding protein n=1 Tax=Kitasatospora sp. MAA4 TaxID=3035093 RepID=UPI002474752B|nr:AMP-binding protein [Kitasatospora sp. MAA4]MDH6135162.1 fatty-acyl-CoA synthase [Kitasatospora sp. MAA4]